MNLNFSRKRRRSHQRLWSTSMTSHSQPESRNITRNNTTSNSQGHRSKAKVIGPDTSTGHSMLLYSRLSIIRTRTLWIFYNFNSYSLNFCLQLDLTSTSAKPNLSISTKTTFAWISELLVMESLLYFKYWLLRSSQKEKNEWWSEIMVQKLHVWMKLYLENKWCQYFIVKAGLVELLTVFDRGGGVFSMVWNVGWFGD